MGKGQLSKVKVQLSQVHQAFFHITMKLRNPKWSHWKAGTICPAAAVTGTTPG